MACQISFCGKKSIAGCGFLLVYRNFKHFQAFGAVASIGIKPLVIVNSRISTTALKVYADVLAGFVGWGFFSHEFYYTCFQKVVNEFFSNKIQQRSINSMCEM